MHELHTKRMFSLECRACLVNPSRTERFVKQITHKLKIMIMFSLDKGSQGLIVLGFNDTSTLEGHFVSSPREREKRDRRESR